MYAIDFIFDGIKLSDLGYILCDFESSSGASYISSGSNISFTKISMNMGRKHSLACSRYEECVSATFDICKDPDKYEQDDRYVTNSEYRKLVRWLNQTEFKQFMFLEEFQEDNVYFNASFNVEKIEIASKICGIRLKMETDGPFGYGDSVKSVFTFNEDENSGYVYAVSDEVGDIYPTLIIECYESGTISITNETCSSTTIIKGCAVGEIITIFGDTKVIESTVENHDICDDFNYEYLKLRSSVMDNKNKLISNSNCKLTLTYQPIIKSVC